MSDFPVPEPAPIDQPTPEPHVERSRVGLNLLTQALAGLLLTGLSSRLPENIGGLIDAAGTIIIALAAFGAVYCVLRLGGIQSDIWEWTVENVPFGMANSTSPLTRATNENRLGARARDVVQVLGGFLLLLLIDGLLLASSSPATAIAAVLVAFLAIAGAEWMRLHNLRSAASVSALTGFAIAEAATAMLWISAGMNGWSPFLQNPHTWVTIQFMFACGLVFILWRHPSPLSSLLYTAIAYASPFLLLFSGARIEFPIGLVFVVLLSAIILTEATLHRRPALWLLNAVFANLYVFAFLGQDLLTANFGAAGVLALIAHVAFYIAHMFLAAAVAKQPPVRETLWIERAHLVTIHILLALGMVSVRNAIPFLEPYLGYGFVAVALAAFVAWLTLRHRVTDPLFAPILAHLAAILAMTGFLIQASGPWRPAIALLYAVAFLAYGQRVYGFVLLASSVVLLLVQWSIAQTGIGPGVVMLAGCVAMMAVARQRTTDAPSTSTIV